MSESIDPKYSRFVGQDADVVSGPHEGRSGRIVHIQDVGIDGRDPEPYALVEFAYQDVFKEVHTDQISVPIRRLTLRR